MSSIVTSTQSPLMLKPLESREDSGLKLPPFYELLRASFGRGRHSQAAYRAREQGFDWEQETGAWAARPSRLRDATAHDPAEMAGLLEHACKQLPRASAYLGSRLWNQVMMPSARWSIASQVSSRFSQRTSRRRNLLNPPLGALHHPAPCLLADLQGLVRLATPRQVQGEAVLFGQGPYRLVVIAPVQAQPLRCVRAGMGVAAQRRWGKEALERTDWMMGGAIGGRGAPSPSRFGSRHDG